MRADFSLDSYPIASSTARLKVLPEGWGLRPEIHSNGLNCFPLDASR